MIFNYLKWRLKAFIALDLILIPFIVLAKLDYVAYTEAAFGYFILFALYFVLITIVPRLNYLMAPGYMLPFTGITICIIIPSMVEYSSILTLIFVFIVFFPTIHDLYQIFIVRNREKELSIMPYSF